MLSLTGAMRRLHTEGRDPVVGLMKYVPFWLVVESQVSVKLQQTPNPWAQFPSALPRCEHHSLAVKQVPGKSKQTIKQTDYFDLLCSYLSNKYVCDNISHHIISYQV